jgi:hypothetical protein
VADDVLPADDVLRAAGVAVLAFGLPGAFFEEEGMD